MEIEKKKKIIIQSVDAFGDNIILTGIPRDIHLMYPSEFLIDVRPAKPEFGDLWRYNPNITPLSGNDPDVEVITLNFSDEWRLMNVRPDHLVQATYQGFSRRFGKMVTPQKFYGDLYFSDEELKLPSLTEALFGRHIPYWLFNSGLQRKDRGDEGEIERSTKTWRPERYDELVEHFKGRILFIQVGSKDPRPRPVRGAINLVNKTDVRSMMLLMKHADGVVCTITSHMHLSAAVAFRKDSHYRPAVVLAGGREPTTFFAYPNHQVLHTVGALWCCAEGGCNRWRVLPLGDNSAFDRNLCLQPIDLIPRCMEMITVNDVANAIDRYYNGGALSYLTAQEAQLVENSPHLDAVDRAHSDQQRRLVSIGLQDWKETKFDLYYINLPDRSDRRNSLERNLSECRLSISWNTKRFEGIRPNDRQKEEHGDELSISELGRFLSHRECLKASLENQHPCMILEDDVMFSMISEKLIGRSLDAIPIGDWDLLFTDIDLRDPQIALKYFLIIKQNANTITFQSLRNIGFLGSRCYIVNKNSKEKVEHFLFGSPPYTAPYDVHIQNKIDDGSLNGYVTLPFLTSSSDASFPSSIQDPENAQRASIFKAFTMLCRIEPDEKKALEILARSHYPNKGADTRSLALSQIIQALVSKEFLQD